METSALSLQEANIAWIFAVNIYNYTWFWKGYQNVTTHGEVDYMFINKYQ